jgi:hypothetical protein
VWLCLGRNFPRAGWHLQHGRVLAWAQFCQLDDLAIWQFERVMMDMLLLLIHLPKPRNLMPEPLVAEPIVGFALKVLFKGKLSAW